MANPITETGAQLFGSVTGSVLWIGLAVIFILIIGGTMIYFAWYRKKFDIKVKINSKRSGDLSVFFDKAAILNDRKTKTKYFRLLNTKYDLTVPPFKVLTKTNKGDYLELYRKSEEEFVYLMPGHIVEEEIIGNDGRLHKVNKELQNHLESDTHWYMTRKEKDKHLFDTESILMKIIPFIPHLVGGVLMIFLLYIVFDKLPPMIASMQQLAESMKGLGPPQVIQG